jgi:hypothetical protein
MDQQALLPVTIVEAIHHQVRILPPGKYVHPFHHGKRDEVDGLLVPDFVAAAHGKVVGLLYLLYVDPGSQILPLHLKSAVSFGRLRTAGVSGIIIN